MKVGNDSRAKMKVDSKELAYYDNLSGVMLEQSPKSSQHLLYSIGLFIIFAITWAGFAEIDEVTVGVGKVIPSQQIQVIQNLEGGIVKEILVREGQTVEIGQSLLSIDDTRFLSDFREQESQRGSLLAASIRLKSELASVQIEKDGGDYLVATAHIVLDFSVIEEITSKRVMERQRAYYIERLRNLINQLEILDQQVNQKESSYAELKSKVEYFKASYDLVDKELKLTKPLAEKGVVSEVELIKLQRTANEVKGELASAKISLPKLLAEISEAKNKRKEVALKFRSESQEKLAEVENKLASLYESLVSVEDRLRRTTVTSPVRGKIKTIKVTTVGGVVQPGMDLMEIVPIEDSLLVEAKISPKDIAFLRPELDSVIKLTAYDFAIYGGLKGTVEHISADTIQDEKDNSYYLIRVRAVDSYYGKNNEKLPIIPGMTASVDVITGKKTVLDYLLKPIIRAKQNALREK